MNNNMRHVDPGDTDAWDEATDVDPDYVPDPTPARPFVMTDEQAKRYADTEPWK